MQTIDTSSHWIRRTVSWVVFFAAILLAWVLMFMSARMSGVDWIGRPVGPNMMPMTAFGALFPMWSIMMAAMMLPTMVPTLKAYEDLIRSANGSRAGWSALLVGYMAIWIAGAAAISAVQVVLISIGWIDGLGIAQQKWFAASLLVFAGAFQFSRTKEICHGVCHAPMTFFLGHWRPGAVGGLRMGLALGLFCVGCCWAFMMLGFVGGVMSLLWMGLATMFMVLEKLPQIGRYVTKPLGGVLIAAGLAVVVF
ncbi:DUF2182 domain-containing protein [Aestuariibius insulae]|uniref:DUF2182 domain-containing protein n=1 Tax=Aestuariibius insulae TaxID=2058287 RepID=UPI00345ECC93